ncbi:MAG TPA: hypothetical protein VD886_00080 [Herpetosiphonaceae bacterium]|nr:hypothetical protein [Herpetosiphonaceae bacterium]
MAWKIVLIAMAFAMPYLARIPRSFTRGADWFWSYLPSPGAFLFFGAFNLIGLAPLAVLGFVSASKGTDTAFLATALVHMAATFLIHQGYDLAADAQAAIGLVVFPLLVFAITAATALVAFFAERAIRG